MASQQARGQAVEKARIEADSWSLVEVEPTIKHDHIFSIANFSKKMEMTAGTCFNSRVFDIQTKDKQTKWALFCYPNGQKEEYQSGVCCFLSPQKIYEVQFQFQFQMSIVNKAGEKVKSKLIKKTFDPSNGIMYGWYSFIRHEVFIALRSKSSSG